jgi:hypothetical protein
MPSQRFDGIVIPFGLTKEEVEGRVFESMFTGLANNKLLTVVVPLARGGDQADRFLKMLHSDLLHGGSFDRLKFQFQGFADYLRSYVSPHLASVESVTKAAEKAGFSIVSQEKFGQSYVLLQFGKLF